MKKIITVFALAVLLNCQEKRETLKRTGEPDVVYFNNSDDEMNVAVGDAQKTLSEFEKAIKSDNPDYSNFTLKQKFDTSDGGGEHIWIGDVQLKDGKYYGVVHNSPADKAVKVKLGDSIEIAPDRISDWMYYDKNVVKGGYTIKVIRKYMSSEEKRQMDAGGLIYE